MCLSIHSIPESSAPTFSTRFRESWAAAVCFALERSLGSPNHSKTLSCIVVRTFGKTTEQGASTTVWAALRADPNDGGAYLKDCSLGKPTKDGLDDNQAKLLWDESIKACGLDTDKVEERFAADPASPKKERKRSKSSKKVVKEKSSSSETEEPTRKTKGGRTASTKKETKKKRKEKQRASESASSQSSIEE